MSRQLRRFIPHSIESRMQVEARVRSGACQLLVGLKDATYGVSGGGLRDGTRKGYAPGFDEDQIEWRGALAQICQRGDEIIAKAAAKHGPRRCSSHWQYQAPTTMNRADGRSLMRAPIISHLDRPRPASSSPGLADCVLSSSSPATFGPLSASLLISSRSDRMDKPKHSCGLPLPAQTIADASRSLTKRVSLALTGDTSIETGDQSTLDSSRPAKPRPIRLECKRRSCTTPPISRTMFARPSRGSAK